MNNSKKMIEAKIIFSYQENTDTYFLEALSIEGRTLEYGKGYSPYVRLQTIGAPFVFQCEEKVVFASGNEIGHQESCMQRVWRKSDVDHFLTVIKNAVRNYNIEHGAGEIYQDNGRISLWAV